MLGTYGTGAIMAVPAHDERDFAFAQAFGLPIVNVVMPKDADPDQELTTAFTEHTVDEVMVELQKRLDDAKRRAAQRPGR